MLFGVTPTGFLRKPLEKIRESIHGYLRTKISPHLKLTGKTGLGSMVEGALTELDELWEVAESCYHANDPKNADEAAFVAVCEITGTERRGATKGVVLATCNLAANRTFAPGALVAHVDGEASNRWVNRDEIVSTTAGSYPGLTFEAETAGAAGKCEAGTLTKIAQTADGWNSITNPAKATPGQDIETLEQLAVRREQELQISDVGPLAAVRGAVSKVAGVIQVTAQTNRTDYWGALPPHSFRVLVWDGVAAAALNDEIAQAIVDAGCAGIASYGQLSGNAIDADGNAEVVKFDRVQEIPIHVDVTVKGSTAGVAAAIIGAGSKHNPGDDVVIAKLRGAVSGLASVTDVVSFTIGTTPSPVGTVNIQIADDRIATFDISNVSVTLAP